MRKLISLVVMTGLSVMFAVMPAFSEEEAPIKYGVNVGDVSKPVTLKTISGDQTINTAKLADKSIFVFVNTVCGMCQRELMDIERQLPDLKVTTYIVVVDQTAERAEKKYEKFKESAVLLHDPDFQLGMNVGLSSTPATLVLEKDGKIVFKESGYQPSLLKSLKEAL